jgi:predicted Zn-dependent protease
LSTGFRKTQNPKSKIQNRMTESVTSLFESGLERYQAGEEPESLISVFKEICDLSPKNAAAWSSLSWLYLLVDKPNSALKAAQKSLKLDSQALQSRINLALAMLETGATGVREQIEAVQQALLSDSQIRQSILENIEDGLARKPDWKNLQRLKKWLEL